MAISTSAKSFISAPLCQKVINQIYSGDVVFSLAATRSILADNYKPRAIQLYAPHLAPFLDHYRSVSLPKDPWYIDRSRLRVPKYGVILEFLNFAILLLTFILCQSSESSCHWWISLSRSTLHLRSRCQQNYSLGIYLHSLCGSLYSRWVYSREWTWLDQYVLSVYVSCFSHITLYESLCS